MFNNQNKIVIRNISQVFTPSLGDITLFQDTDGVRKYKRSDGTIGTLIDIGQGNIFKIKDSSFVGRINNATSDEVFLIPTTDGIPTIEILQKIPKQSGGGGGAFRLSTSTIGMNLANDISGAGHTSNGYQFPGLSGAPTYITFYGVSSSTLITQNLFIMPMSGTLSNFYVRLPLGQTIANTLTFRVKKNAQSTSLFVSVPAVIDPLTTLYSDKINSVIFNEGDSITVEVINNTNGILSAPVSMISFKITS